MVMEAIIQMNDSELGNQYGFKCYMNIIDVEHDK